MSQPISLLIVLTAIGCGLTAGAFFAFSTFIMEALKRIPTPAGISAMQSINVAVINPWFMSTLFLPVVFGMVLVGWSVMNWSRDGVGLLIAGELTYALGTVGVTIACNIPRNNRLAVVDPNSETGAAVWATYLREWTMFNHVRTIGAVVAMVLLLIAWGKLKGATSLV